MAKFKGPISTRMIDGARCTRETENKLRESIPGMPLGAQINLMVFEVHIDKQIRYCCWSGGSMRDEHGADFDEPKFTLVGSAAFEALANLPFADPQGTLIVKELRIGPTPLREKVLKTFRQTADTRELICFIGDMQGELDGHLPAAFSMEGTVNLVDCVGLKKPWD